MKKRSMFDNYGYTIAHNLVNYLAFDSITYYQWLTKMNKETFSLNDLKLIRPMQTQFCNSIFGVHLYVEKKRSTGFRSIEYIKRIKSPHNITLLRIDH